jgi:hypothetical protein
MEVLHEQVAPGDVGAGLGPQSSIENAPSSPVSPMLDAPR